MNFEFFGERQTTYAEKDKEWFISEALMPEK